MSECVLVCVLVCVCICVGGAERCGAGRAGERSGAEQCRRQGREGKGRKGKERKGKKTRIDRYFLTESMKKDPIGRIWKNSYKSLTAHTLISSGAEAENLLLHFTIHLQLLSRGESWRHPAAGHTNSPAYTTFYVSVKKSYEN